ncbi:MAG: AsmA-like C-terminal region-containing protein, partial [Porticoccaceae bacterium]|nr:AsmA-like C-terminal region-containing protein [Porticoccaceae bacterium]
LQGTIYFDQGNAIFLDPLKMEMPSGRMSMAGTFNLIDETTEAQLVATLPVATNLPWVVALLGGIPAAAGVYITSKIVQKQVDRLSSISYELTGPWDDIDITVDEIFASELENQPSPETQSNDQ